MKRIIAAALTVAAFTLTACGTDNDQPASGATPPPVAVSSVPTPTASMTSAPVPSDSPSVSASPSSAATSCNIAVFWENEGWYYGEFEKAGSNFVGTVSGKNVPSQYSDEQIDIHPGKYDITIVVLTNEITSLKWRGSGNIQVLYKNEVDPRVTKLDLWPGCRA